MSPTEIRVVRRSPLWPWLAGLVLAFLVFPWPVAKELSVLDRFDPVLATVNEHGYLPGRGRITLDPALLAISALPRSQPTVHLLTTEGDFRARFTVRVIGITPHEVYPVQIKLWNPAGDVAVEAWFSPVSQSIIHAGYRVHDRWVASWRVGAYEVGEPVTVEVWRARRDAGIQLSTADWMKLVRVSPTDFPLLFSQDNLSVTVYASSPGNGSARAEYTGYQVTVPGLGPYGAVLADGPARVLALALWLFIAFGLVFEALRRGKGTGDNISLRPPAEAHRGWLILPIAIFLAVVVAAPLSLIGSHPYDMYSNRLWAYAATRYGLPALYTVAAIGTEGFSHGGDPYAAAAFPYPPLIGYLFKAAGEIYQQMGGTGWVGDPRLALGLKLAYLSFHALGALLVYRLLVRAHISERGRVAALLAYLFSPPILWGAVVWGQVDTLLLLMLLVAFVGIEERNPTVAWLGILGAVTIKQTGLLFAVIFVALLARRVGTRNFLGGFARSGPWFFLLAAPLIWSGIHPVSFIYPTWVKFLQFGTVRWMEVSNAVVSRDAFNLWTLITYFAGARGVGRMAFPDHVPLPWVPVSYVDAARLLTAGLIGYLGFLLLKRRWIGAEDASTDLLGEPVVPAPQDTQARLLVVATYLVGVIFLSTRVTERYYTFGLAFLAIGAPILRGQTLWLAYGAITVSALVAMYGSLVQIGTWYPGSLPRLAQESYPFNALALHLYTSDVWISVFSVLTLLAVVLLLLSVGKVGVKD